MILPIKTRGFVFLLVWTVLCISSSYGDELNISGKGSGILKNAVNLHRQGQTTPAAAEYRLYLKKHSDVAPVYFFLGNLYWETGFPDKALSTYKKSKQACVT